MPSGEQMLTAASCAQWMPRAMGPRGRFTAPPPRSCFTDEQQVGQKRRVGGRGHLVVTKGAPETTRDEVALDGLERRPPGPRFDEQRQQPRILERVPRPPQNGGLRALTANPVGG